MKITGSFYGYSSKGKAAFGVHLICDKQEYSTIVNLKEATNNLAELHAIEYALKAIVDKDCEVELESCNSYVPRLFTKIDGAYKVKAERNVDMVNRARDAAGNLNVKVTMGKSDLTLKLQDLVKKTVNGTE